MKAERENGYFQKIVITIETREEAEYLWHKLNCGSDWQHYQKRRGYKPPFGIPHDMWGVLDRVFSAGLVKR